MYNDLIDFPCSDTWLDYYYEKGMTPRKSSRPSTETLELRKLIKTLEEQNRLLVETQEKLNEMIGTFIQMMLMLKNETTNTLQYQYQNEQYVEHSKKVGGDDYGFFRIEDDTQF